MAFLISIKTLCALYDESQGQSAVFDLISKKPNGKDSVSSDEPIKCTGQSGVPSAKAVSGDSLSKKPNGKTVVSSTESIKHSSGTGVPKSQPISSCSSLPYLPFNGGDLIKWDKARIGFKVGIDIAEGSVELDKILEEDALLLSAVASFLCNIHGLLRHVHDGLWQCLSSFLSVFIGTTPDANVIIKNLTRLTLSHEQYDLELVFVKNSHEFVHDYMKKTELVELMRRLGALGDGNQDQSKSL
ncbi:hypothetical protein Bca52824_053475 [Brassica carinata]|uniref:Uncharacterized protein n=1 Tax=Brassica carinata TaxID=52824 RepID=A0A8X7UJN2_BRACI|nr:hypothetical protein Bca52824_053475 [Brassica carinata]